MPVGCVAAGEGHVAGDEFDARDGARELLYLIQEQHAGWCILALVPSAEASGGAVQAP